VRAFYDLVWDTIFVTSKDGSNYVLMGNDTFVLSELVAANACSLSGWMRELFLFIIP
jgi:hypothetical protein